MARDGDAIMSKPDMSGRKDLGIYRNPKAQDIPKQSKAPTRTGDGGSTKRKMKKVMKSAGMLDNC